MTMPAPQPERRSQHNASVDEDLVQRGACGQTHLPTGRTCVLTQNHRGSCEFVPRDRVESSLAELGPQGR
jgi:hypothetical protein